MALVRTVEVAELKPQPREQAFKRPSRDRLLASLGERSLHKQIERADQRRRLRGSGIR